MKSRQKLLILGVTASGKSRLAFELAKALNAEIISVDSMKVYRRMDIGTAKPDSQKRSEVGYHLIDVVEPSEAFSVGRFIELAGQAAADIKKRGKNIIAVGGTALYIKALLHGLFEGPGSSEQVREKLRAEAGKNGLGSLYSRLEEVDPSAAENIHPNDARRIIRALEVYTVTGKPISSFQTQFDSEPADDWLVIGLRRKKEQENKRMNARVKRMLEAGLVEEVKGLLAEEEPLSKQARCAIGYAEIIEHLEGKTTLDEAVEEIKKNTRKLAKGQRTWFKTFANVNWLDIDTGETPESVYRRATELIENSSV